MGDEFEKYEFNLIQQNFIDGKFDEYENKITALKAQLASAKEVIGWYASGVPWHFTDDYKGDLTVVIDESDISMSTKKADGLPEYECEIGGKKAREWLNSLRGDK